MLHPLFGGVNVCNGAAPLSRKCFKLKPSTYQLACPEEPSRTTARPRVESEVWSKGSSDVSDKLGEEGGQQKAPSRLTRRHAL